MLETFLVTLSTTLYFLYSGLMKHSAQIQDCDTVDFGQHANGTVYGKQRYRAPGAQGRGQCRAFSGGMGSFAGTGRCSPGGSLRDEIFFFC